MSKGAAKKLESLHEAQVKSENFRKKMQADGVGLITEDPTKGSKPLLAQAPTITIGDRTYQMRRLGIMDIFRLTKMVTKLTREGQKQAADILQNVGDMGKEVTIGAMLALGFTELADDICEFLGGMIGVSAGEYADPNQFPLEYQIQMVHLLLAEHPDIDGFFTQLRNMGQDEKLKQRIQRAISSGK